MIDAIHAFCSEVYTPLSPPKQLRLCHFGNKIVVMIKKSLFSSWCSRFQIVKIVSLNKIIQAQVVVAYQQFIACKNVTDQIPAKAYVEIKPAISILNSEFSQFGVVDQNQKKNYFLQFNLCMKHKQ